MTPAEWKEYYRREHDALGEAGLARLLDAAPPVEMPERGVVIFPHARLAECGRLVAAAALAAVRSGRDDILAIGVYHGGPRDNPAMRRVHEEVPGEFSLDNFEALLGAAARREGRPAPRLIRRFPFLTGDDPAGLPGLDEVRRLINGGAAVVATADPIHHGAGYATPERRPISDLAWARTEIERHFLFLARGEFAAFARHAERIRSDFRDAGPALACALGGPLTARVVDVAMVDYAEALAAEPPTWVAGALATLTC